LFEVLTHGRAAAGDNASTPTLYVMAEKARLYLREALR
jgi:hypothetical protein